MGAGEGPVTPRTETAVVSASVEGINEAIEAFGRFSRAGHIPAEVRRKCQLALDEVLSNVVRHGLAGSVGEIHLAFHLTSDEVMMKIEDEAPAFNPLMQPQPDVDAPVERRRPGGLGVALIRELMDEVQYQRRNNLNCLTMMSRLTGGTPYSESRP